MLESLSIRNFKVLREVDVDLKPLSVIVGPNASGKSSILQALAICLDPSQAPADDPLLTALRSRNSKEGIVLSVRLDGSECKRDFSGRQYIWAPLKWKPVLLDLDPRKLSAPSYPKDASLSLPTDGEGLSSLLAGLKLEKPDRFTQIVERLRSVVPNLEGVRIRRVPLDANRVGDEILFDMLGAEGIPAKAASHGTLLTLGVLAALSVHDGPQVILIDDLERGLHPKAMASFIQQLRGIQSPLLQIVATSHSPYLIDCMKADEVLLTSLDESGYAVVRPLTDHPEYESWKGFMAPGEFWSSVGEDWVTKEKKATAR